MEPANIFHFYLAHSWPALQIQKCELRLKAQPIVWQENAWNKVDGDYEDGFSSPEILATVFGEIWE